MTNEDRRGRARRSILTVVLLGAFMAASIASASTAQAGPLESEVTYRTVEAQCYGNYMNAKVSLRHRYTDTQMENPQASYRLRVYKWSPSTGEYSFWTTSWSRPAGLNYASGQMYFRRINPWVSGNYYTVGIQVAVYISRTATWIWDDEFIYATSWCKLS